MQHKADNARSPLSGIRVLDLTRVLSGPYCTRLLCDLGADVIKVEPPTADPTRGMGTRIHGLSPYFTQQNAGKRYVCIDLEQEGSAKLLLELIAVVDVLVDNFRPGVMDSLGLSEQVLHDTNPRLVHGMISGFGQQSASQDKRAYAGVVHAMSGFIHEQARADRTEPRDSSWAIGDTATGVHACNAIIAALFMRERTGEGQTVDIAMHDVMLSINETAVFYLYDDPATKDLQFRGHVIKCRDGSFTFSADPVWSFDRFGTALGKSVKDDPRFASLELRRQNAGALIDALRNWAASRAVEDASATLEAHGLPNGRIRSVAEAVTSAEARSRGMVKEIDDRQGGTVRVVNSPYRFSAAETGVRGPAGYRGEHNEEVLAELLNYDSARIRELEEAGVVIRSKKRSSGPS